MNASAVSDAVNSGNRVMEGIIKPKVSPIYASSAYSFETLADLDRIFDGE